MEYHRILEFKLKSQLKILIKYLKILIDFKRSQSNILTLNPLKFFFFLTEKNLKSFKILIEYTSIKIL